MWCIFMVLLYIKSTINMNTMHLHDVFPYYAHERLTVKLTKLEC